MLFQPAADIFKHFLMVRFHQQFMPGTGVQLALNVLHTGIFQALDGTLHALALFAHRVGIASQEQQRQVFGHLCKERRVVQAQDAAEHAVVGVQRKGKAKVANTNCTILIQGESGVGKEVMAKCIHNASNRKERPMIKVNCASIPENLLESELFGYEEGAFTGARKGGKLGKFELANKGTILLDEIGDMSLTMQSKLLRVLQEKELERVGGTKTIKLDVRVIAATNQNLEEMVEKNEFRSDLYYRLHVVPIHIPALRCRREDIMPLVRYFIERNGGDEGTDLTPGAARMLEEYGWPGNVRELQNVIEYAMIVKTGDILEIKDFPQYLRGDGAEDSPAEDGPCRLKDAVEQLEKSMIKRALKRNNGNKSMAINELGLSRRSFYEKLEKYGLK